MHQLLATYGNIHSDLNWNLGNLTTNGQNYHFLFFFISHLSSIHFV